VSGNVAREVLASTGIFREAEVSSGGLECSASLQLPWDVAAYLGGETAPRGVFRNPKAALPGSAA
jgi:hypothetical protein